MNQPTPAPSRDTSANDNAARRNYLVFCGVSALLLFVIVLVGSLFAAAG